MNYAGVGDCGKSNKKFFTTPFVGIVELLCLMMQEPAPVARGLVVWDRRVARGSDILGCFPECCKSFVQGSLQSIPSSSDHASDQGHVLSQGRITFYSRTKF